MIYLNDYYEVAFKCVNLQRQKQHSEQYEQAMVGIKQNHASAT